MSRRVVLALALVAVALGGCNASDEHRRARTRPDTCLEDKLQILASIDHETPSGDALRELIRFCEEQYSEAAP